MTRWYKFQESTIRYNLSLLILLLVLILQNPAIATSESLQISQALTNTNANLVGATLGQTFSVWTTNENMSILTRIDLDMEGYSGTYNVSLSIYTDSTKTVLLGTSYNNTIASAGWYSFNFSNISLMPEKTNYYFETNYVSGGSTIIWFLSNVNPYSGGNFSSFGANYDGTFKIYGYNSLPLLYTPINATTLSKSYPPLTSNINFTWLDGSPYSSNLLIAKDSSFNLIVTDTTISTNYSVQSLEAGNYWWKVRYYNSTSGTHGNYSDTFNFTLSNTQTVSGTNIQGTIYELLNGVQSNIDQAYVEIYNATWTQTMVTGTNGYYLFQNLAADTYWVRAYKDGYDTTVGQAITPVAGITTTQNILMKKTLNQYVPLDHYVKFTVQTLWGTRYPNVLVSAFEGSDVIASKTGTTGTDGSTSLLLIKDQSYRITAVNASQGINTEITITPSEIEYYIIVTSSVTPWFEGGSQPESDVISFVVTSSEINATHAYINASYNDSMAQTTAWTIYLNQSNTTNGQSNQTKLQSSTGTGNGNVSFIVSGYTGKNYLVNLVATHTTFGTIKRSYGVGFKGLPGGQLDFIPNILKAMIAIGLLIFVAAMFGQTSKSQGAGVVCAVGWILLALGFFAYFDTIKIAAGLTIATVFAIVVNMSERNKQEGMT